MNTFTNSAGLEVRVKSPQRGQVMMHMLSLDEMIRAEHPVRNVWQYVCSLDLSAFYQDIQAVKGGVGRDAVDPRILLALWIFATLEGVGSARRLAELCTRDFAYLWICGEVTVNRDLLNSFRSSHPEALDEIMIETIGILLDQGLVSLTRVAQDGMRVRASAGKSSFHRQSTLAQHLEEARQQVEQLRQEGDDDQAGRSRQEAARQRAAEERLERLEKALEEGAQLRLKKEQQKRNEGVEVRSSSTDPEARNMKMADGGYRPAYNVQFATACDSRIIVGVDVTNEGADSGQMEPMTDQLQANFQQLPTEYLVDGGFSSRDDTTQLEQRGVKVYSPIKKEEKLLQAGEDPYARRRGDTDEYYAYRQRMKSPEAKEIYKLRCSTAEFPNAGCRNRGLHQFTVRGLKKTRTAAIWQALAHNLQMILYHGWLPTILAG
ncbi:MAG: IS1182 family transposase [Planctomycetales bacterium]|nr:IS1182 family transposase [Planctomycetales bacterium]